MTSAIAFAALTESVLLAVMPRVPDVPTWTAALNEAMERFEIAPPWRAAAFLAHVGHESDDCRRLTENLNYSAARLMAVWPRRFPSLEAARPYAHQPERLANRVYANRLGNGDEESGDGWRFRGRALMQITGRSNYRACGAALGMQLEAHPESLEQPLPAALAAAHFWAAHGCNALADCPPGAEDDEDFVRITKIINGGTHGLADRRRRWRHAKAVLASA